MSEILITGVSGFIGAALKNYLQAQGHSVYGTSRKYLNDKAVYQVPSIGAETQWSEILKGIDVVIHLAARAHIVKRESEELEILYEQVNYHGTKRLAEECVNNNVRRFIYLSSIGVNGPATDSIPFTEESIPEPVGAYAISKNMAEQALNDIADNSQIEIAIIRPPLVYGPGAKGNFHTLLELVQRGIPIPVKGVHNQRSMIALTNLVDIISRLSTSESIKNRLYVVSDGRDLSTDEIISMIARSMRKKPRLIKIPRIVITTLLSLVGKVGLYNKLAGSLAVDSSAITRDLNWKPVISIEEEIDNAVEWYKMNPDR